MSAAGRRGGVARPMPTAPRHQRGLSALLMIAVLVLLGGLTVYAFGLVTSVHSGYARQVAATRADLAAQAGLDWGRYRITAIAVAACAPLQTFTTLPGTLGPYTVSVRCTVSGPYTETLPGPPPTPVTRNTYRLTATACNAPLSGACPNTVAGPTYVEHTATALITR